MRRFLSLLLTAICLFTASAPALASETTTTGTDYSMADKLLMQLRAGSGFSGTLTLEVDANEGKLGQGLTTQKPLVMNVDYIYVRASGTETADRRADLTLMDGETAQTSAHFQLKDGKLALQADVIGTDWYSLNGIEAADDGSDAQGAAGVLKQAGSELLEKSGVPTLANFLLPLFQALKSPSAEMTEMLNVYTMHTDLWIEGYRQDAALSKLEDGTTIMETRYAIAPEDIKAQVKWLVNDVIANQTASAPLRALMGEDDARLYLNPNLQSFYTSAIDALPISGDLTISRTVSLTGATLDLHLSLPLYDRQSGNVTLRYDREHGKGDLPNQNQLSIESDTRNLSFSYLESTDAPDERVWQGFFKSEDKAADGSGENAAQQTDTAVAFTLRLKETERKDEENRNVLEWESVLSLAPDTEGTPNATVFPATDITLNAAFAGKELKTAATEMNAELSIGGDEWAQTIKLTMEGRSRKKWDPDAIPEERVDLGAMTQAEWDALLPGIVARGGLIALQYFNLPTDEPTNQTAAPEETPLAFETLAPQETQTPAP